MAPWGLQFGDVLERSRDRLESRRQAGAHARRLVVDDHSSARPSCAVRTRSTSATSRRASISLACRRTAIFSCASSYEDLDSGRAQSEPVIGRFRTPPKRHRDIRFVWGGDTAGQGWGIDLGFGGMRIYESMRLAQPDFFIHSGDTIYADGPLRRAVTDATGNTIWTNAFLDVVPEKLKVAETLQEYRRNYLYNFYDANVQRFAAEVPQIWQWDDHEVTNNWSDAKELDARYTERRVQTLTARATRAFLEYAPMRWHSQAESERVYRHIPYGRDLDVFVVDMRSYRGPNTFNLQDQPSAETAFLGERQLAWLRRSCASRARLGKSSPRICR